MSELNKPATVPSVDDVVLLPCPFCGGAAVEDEEEVGTQTKHWACCSCCNAMSYSFASSQHAAQTWNNRRSDGLVDAWVRGETVCPQESFIVSAMGEYMREHIRLRRCGMDVLASAELDSAVELIGKIRSHFSL